MAGRKPKLTAAKEQKIIIVRENEYNESAPAKGMPVCHDWFMPKAKGEYK